MPTLLIDDYRFGRIVIGGRSYTRDVLVRDGRVLPDWWRADGHRCTLADLERLRPFTFTHLVLGCGASGLLRPEAAMLEALGAKGVQCVCLPTAEAVARFNELQRLGASPAAGFHLTC